MKTIYIKSGLGLLIVLAAFTAKAQTNTKPATANNIELRMMHDASHTENGKRVEKIEAELNDKFYHITQVDEKMTDLYVDGAKIPAADWGKYSDAIDAIHQEMKEQAKRDAEQAIRNKEQEKRNAEQAVRNQEQAKRNAEQAVRNEEQAKRNAEQRVRDSEQVTRNKEQEKRNAEQAIRNEEQAKKNAEQAMRDSEQVTRNKEQETRNAEQAVRNKEQETRDAEQSVRNKEQEKRDAEQVERNKEQEKRNAEQAVRNEIQAKRNEAQAKAMEQLLKDLAADLANDKIIKDKNDLREFKINEFGMSVNGVRQPEEVFKRYHEKYVKEKYRITREFNYSRDGMIQSQ